MHTCLYVNSSSSNKVKVTSAAYEQLILDSATHFAIFCHMLFCVICELKILFVGLGCALRRLRLMLESSHPVNLLLYKQKATLNFSCLHWGKSNVQGNDWWRWLSNSVFLVIPTFISLGRLLICDTKSCLTSPRLLKSWCPVFWRINT